MGKQTKSEAAEASRMWASASFVGVLIVIGLPLWWKTTEVYRVSLPYDKIAAFDSLSHTIATEVTVMANDEATASEIAGLIEKSFEDSTTLKLKVTKTVLSDSLRSALESVADDPEAVEEVASTGRVSRPNTLHVVQRSPLFQKVWLSGERVLFFRDSKGTYRSSSSKCNEQICEDLLGCHCGSCRSNCSRRVSATGREGRNENNKSYFFRKSVQDKKILQEFLSSALESDANDPEAVEEVASTVRVSRPNTLHVVQRTPLFQKVWLSGERVLFFKDCKAGPTVIQALKNWIYQTSVLQGAVSDSDEARRTRFPPGGGYHVTLSVAVPSPKTKLRFPARDAMEDYIGTFVDDLSVLHNFTLKSQWMYLLDFDFQAKEVKDTSEYGRHFAVRKDRLHLLLTRLEERAATHVSELPTINLVLYAVPCERAPLVIYDDDTRVQTSVQAFMSPKWGGVVIANPTEVECRTDAEMEPNVPRVMGSFLAQLRPLLGIPTMAPIEDAELEPLRSVRPRRWEVDALLRLRVLEQVTSAENTLQSLAQLLGEISNIVINDEVGASINAAVHGIGLAREHLASGDLVEAYKSSRAAHHAAETAFMEPSLLALLYFPDDQKYAIYIPLFLPIMFPVVLSLKTLILWLRGKPLHKEKAD